MIENVRCVLVLHDLRRYGGTYDGKPAEIPEQGFHVYLIFNAYWNSWI